MSDDTSTIELIPVDENDPLLVPMTEYLESDYRKKIASENLFTKLFIVGITSAAILLKNRPYIYSVMEVSLPNEFKAANLIFRQYFLARKQDLDLLPPTERNKVLEARISRQTKIMPFIRRNFNKILVLYGDDTFSTPEKSSKTPLPQIRTKNSSLEPESPDSPPPPVNVSPVIVTTPAVSKIHITTPEIPLLAELDEETGELVQGEDLGSVEGTEDLDDEAEDSASEKEEEIKFKKAIIRRCIVFMTKRLDFYLSEGIDISFISMNDPFRVKPHFVQDILADVGVQNELFIENDVDSMSNDCKH